VFKLSFYTPFIQTNNFQQDMQDTYEDLLNYPSTSDDLRALSQCRRETQDGLRSKGWWVVCLDAKGWGIVGPFSLCGIGAE